MPCRCFIVPPHILRHVAGSQDVDNATRDRARQNLEHLQAVLGRIKAPGQSQSLYPVEDGQNGQDDALKGKPLRSVFTMNNSEDESKLPGEKLRVEGDPKCDDKAADEAFDNVGIVLDFYKAHFKWQSINNKNVKVVSSVHFGERYENAFWDPEKLQMVFGDGDDFLNNFTGCIDVIGHELTHAVTEHTSPLDYYGQAGALNEHVSDVFGIMIKQQVQKEDSDHADWLIGEDCLLPKVKGTALRSMKAPGTAYDDPRFGKDPQVASMKEYRVTVEDNGGVHIFSGIPNKAFYLAAKSFGGYSWEKAGMIWWKTMRSGDIPPNCTFEQFAETTIKVAEKEFSKEAAQKVRKAWSDVGVIAKVTS